MATTNEQAPILASWKISEVLKRYPALLDVLVEMNPAFRPLRNPLMRKVQSRLVTVRQAAEIAGMQPAALVRALNQAAGLSVPDEVIDDGPGAAWEDAPPWVESADVVTDVDVRPLQRQGQEPFSVIMAATRSVGVGQAFRLLNTFEPVPLYDVLGRRGFVHWARQRGPEDWEILFFNTGASRKGGGGAPAPAATAPEMSWDEPTATLTIDVSELVPPEPMVRILAALEDLPAGGKLLVHHVRRPLHLYPRLDERGYRHETRELGPNKIEVLIEKPGPDGEVA